jgi:hypothetical protein
VHLVLDFVDSELTLSSDVVIGVHSGVDGQKVNQVGTERVLAGETDLNALRLDELKLMECELCILSLILLTQN